MESINPAWIGVIVSFLVFCLTGLGVVIAFVRWGIGLEAKNSRLAEKVDRSEKDIAELEQTLTGHMLNTAVHFNAEVSKQVDEKNEQRFGHLENQLAGVAASVDKLVGKVDSLRDAVKNERS